MNEDLEKIKLFDSVKTLLSAIDSNVKTLQTVITAIKKLDISYGELIQFPEYIDAITILKKLNENGE